MSKKGIDNITKPVYELLSKEKVGMYPMENATTLTSKQIDMLRCGDILVKEDEAGKHAYIVSYKKEDEMCITYCDHARIEEVYYEKGVNGWTYVQTDTTELLEGKLTGKVNMSTGQYGYYVKSEDIPTSVGIYELDFNNKPIGLMIITTATGNIRVFTATLNGKYYLSSSFNVTNDLIFRNYELSSGTQLYRHEIPYNDNEGGEIIVISTRATAYTSILQVIDDKNAIIEGGKDIGTDKTFIGKDLSYDALLYVSGTSIGHFAPSSLSTYSPVAL